MKSDKGFQEDSYRRHASHFDDHRAGAAKSAHAATWLDAGTVDAWRHRRMYRLLDPLLETDPGCTWLTVGDGRYGNDARYVIEHGGDALASDISDTLLAEANAGGHIPAFRRENAESMTFDDSQFDYVLCKESYHHFPRPMLALYEMLRVARKGVVLIEPNDDRITRGLSGAMFNTIRAAWRFLSGKPAFGNAYEDSGNYVYSVSRREMEKVALGLNLGFVAFRGINDAYLPGVEHEPLAANGPLQGKIRSRIRIADLICKLRITDYRLLAVVVWKVEPSAPTVRAVENRGFEFIRLPRNPHVAE